MTIHIIGSEGFIGKAIQRNAWNYKLQFWSHSYLKGYNNFDLLNQDTWQNLFNSSPETVLILSWPGLPNYNQSFHISRNLPLFIEFIEKLINIGCKNIICAGTCYEYGLLNGPLKEITNVKPISSYAKAKDSLRKKMELICKSNSVRWVWARIFYPYGIEQNENSLYPSLINSIKKNQIYFDITSGNQLRDFISSDQVAKNLLYLSASSEAYGIFNCGSGEPISIFDFVQKIVKEKKSSIKIRRGKYPDRDDEPKSFWADMSKFNSLIN